MVSKRLLAISRDPWTRARYFIERHGKLQALYFALGKGKLLNEQVLDVCVLLHSLCGQILILRALDPGIKRLLPIALPHPMRRRTLYTLRTAALHPLRVVSNPLLPRLGPLYASRLSQIR